MATTAQQIRLKIQDIPVLADVTLYGDGIASTFLLNYANLTSGSAFVPSAAGGGWSGTGATFNASGSVSFATAISANSAFRLSYVHSTFSDDDIDTFLSAGGTVVGASMEALVALMFDATKRARWMASDSSSYDDTSAQSHLRGMYELLQAEVEKEAVFSGGIDSWSVNQG